jgi:hypothetical protein
MFGMEEEVCNAGAVLPARRRSCALGPRTLLMLGLLGLGGRAQSANELLIQAGQETCCLAPGQSVTLLLVAANLAQPINGVQLVVGYDPSRLLITAIIPGDGAGSPWDGAVEVEEDLGGVEITYALIRFGGTTADAVVARLQIVATAAGSTPVVLLAQATEGLPFDTRFTRYPEGEFVLPALGPAMALLCVAVPGDSDGDDDIDAADFLRLAMCLGGPGWPQGSVAPCCCVGTDADGDVDLADYAALQIAGG